MSPQAPNTQIFRSARDAIQAHPYWDLIDKQREAVTLTLSLINQTRRNKLKRTDNVGLVIDRMSRLVNSNRRLKEILLDAFEAVDAYDSVMASLSKTIMNDIDNAIEGNTPLTGFNLSETVESVTASMAGLADIIDRIANNAVDVFSDIKP